MAYDLRIIKNKKIIEIRNSGEITNEDMITETQEVIKLQHEKNIVLILTEFVSVKVDASLSDVFQFPEMYEQMGMDRKTRIAVLVSEIEVNNEELDFYETICINRGWTIKIFIDKKEAIEWLLSE